MLAEVGEKKKTLNRIITPYIITHLDVINEVGLEISSPHKFQNSSLVLAVVVKAPLTSKLLPKETANKTENQPTSVDLAPSERPEWFSGAPPPLRPLLPASAAGAFDKPRGNCSPPARPKPKKHNDDNDDNDDDAKGCNTHGHVNDQQLPYGARGRAWNDPINA